MQCKFTFKHLEALQSIEDYATTRIEKINKFSLHKEPKVHFIFSVQKQDQKVEVLVDVGPEHFAAHAKDPVLYAAIDKVMDKLERQLAKRKEKIQNHHFQNDLAQTVALETLETIPTASRFKKAD